MPDNYHPKTRISLAKPEDRQRIYAMRHDVYAQELGQHAMNPAHSLTDSLDEFNEYIVAHVDDDLAGFISITPPGFARYSVDKYIARDILPIRFDESLYEVRLLTIAQEFRNGRLAPLLMYAAFRWIEEKNGKHIVAIGRTEVLSIYLKSGLESLNHQVRSGAVTFDLLHVSIDRLRAQAERNHRYCQRLARQVAWNLDIPFFKPACCFHGGAFFEAIGARFDALERRNQIVNADVLDAWFPPSPKVLDAMREHLPWLMSTSPPTHSEGLRAAIAESRGVDEDNILPGAGSSDLIYLVFRHWLSANSQVLILDPMYGEYEHILQNVIGCKIDRLTLRRSNNYIVDLDELKARIGMGYDLIVLVNPNNPTGQHVPRKVMEAVLARVPATTRIWLDEAYLEYVGPGESLEQFASRSESVIVCKSMSKVYALSGMRVAYLCASMHQLSALVSLTPPWAVSLPAQVAAVRALEDEPYYLERYRDTRALRAELVGQLKEIGIREIVPGLANFVLCHLEPDHPTAAEVASESRKHGVFLRDVSLMGRSIGERAIRIAVKNRATNARIVEALEKVLCASNTCVAL
ncbi:MAG: histidinol-phosphate transaminase [Terracidiphilus sp.]|jgi:histidinol-phosphate/aromatic aminotransferase/cobyric acid decarboxylase-like protein